VRNCCSARRGSRVSLIFVPTSCGVGRDHDGDALAPVPGNFERDCACPLCLADVQLLKLGYMLRTFVIKDEESQQAQHNVFATRCKSAERGFCQEYNRQETCISGIIVARSETGSLYRMTTVRGCSFPQANDKCWWNIATL
jgi:hypothetical protein